jgi:signal transduction histidine kinase
MSREAEGVRDGYVFADRLRRLFVWWVAVSVPVVLILGSFVHGAGAYLFVWALVSGLYTTPGLVVTWLLVRRVQPSDRLFWQIWFAALAWAYVMGLTLQASVLTDTQLTVWWSTAATGIDILLFAIPLVMMLRSRSGGRAISLDVVEVAMILVSLLAPVTLLVAEPIIETDEAWWVVPSAGAAAWLFGAFAWAIVLFVRLGAGRRVVEGLGIAAALAGGVTAVANVGQGLSHFTLPSGPLLALQAISLGLVLLTTLHVPQRPPEGLDRLPPQQRIPRGWFVAVVSLLALPVLAVETVLVRDRVSWAGPYAYGVVAVLVLLSTLRHALGLGDTKRLYAEVQQAAEQRRALLTDVMRSAEEDRHRVAAQLHERAVSSYAAFVSFVRATSGDRPTAAPITDPSTGIRNDLQRHADDLRRLMLAIKPLEANAIGPRKLEAPIRAHLDSLYGDAPGPRLGVDITGDLELDWITETVVLRIVQEALQNIRNHAHAREVSVSVTSAPGVVSVAVTDDGVGFEPERVPFHSGIATMHSFAAFADGVVEIDSTPGGGTRVVARLGGAAIDLAAQAVVPGGTPSLRLLPGGADPRGKEPERVGR